MTGVEPNRSTALLNRIDGGEMDELKLAQSAVFMRSRDYAEKPITMYVATNRWAIDPAQIDRGAIREWVWGPDTQPRRRHR